MHSLDAIMAWVMETRTRINISRELPQQENDKVIDNIMVSSLRYYTTLVFDAGT